MLLVPRSAWNATTRTLRVLYAPQSGGLLAFHAERETRTSQPCLCFSLHNRLA